MKIRTTQHHNFSAGRPGADLNWSAIDDDTYDGAPDSRSPVGWGFTEGEAIQDLKEQLR